MDKAEYQEILDQIQSSVSKKDYQGAYELAKKVDWRRVKSLRTLNMVADIYEYNKDYADCKKILLIAKSRATIGKGVLYRLVETCVKLGEIDEAKEYYTQYEAVAGNDGARYLLKYQIGKAANIAIEQQIALLEKYKEYEYTEKWSYELAVLYSRAGNKEKCVEVCDDMILWFSEGKYVLKAMELKQRYAPLTPSQLEYYNKEQKDSDPRLYTGDLGFAAAILAKGTQSEAPQVDAPKLEIPEEYMTGGVMERIEAAGAKATENVEYDKTGVLGLRGDEIDKYSVTSPVFMGGAPDLKTELAESVEKLYPEKKEEEQEAAAETYETAAVKNGEDDAVSGRLLAYARNVETGSLMNAETKDIRKTPEPAEWISPEIITPVADPAELPVMNADAENPAAEAVQGAAPVAVPADEAASAEIPADETAGEAAPAEIPADETAGEAASGKAQKITAPEILTAGAAAASAATPSDEGAQQASEAEENKESAAKTVAIGAAFAAAGAAVAAAFHRDNKEEREAKAAQKAAAKEAAALRKAQKEAEEREAAARKAEKEAEEREKAQKRAEEKAAREAAEKAAAEKEAAEKEAAAKAALLREAAEKEAAELDAAVKEVEERDAAAKQGGDPSKKAAPAPTFPADWEIPDPEETEEEKKSHTIPLGKIGQNTVPIPIEEVLLHETPEERRIRILNNASPTKMSDEQRQVFTYFSRIPGMDSQILEAVTAVYKNAGEHTSRLGNIAIMGASGMGKTRLTYGLIVMMCKDMQLEAAKIARIRGERMNDLDPAALVAEMSGGFLAIENAGDMNAETVNKLSSAMEFKTDRMVVILEDEKNPMRALFRKYPGFGAKFNGRISIPAFTNDELVTFARTYCAENNCELDEMGVLALYTLISNNQTEEQPVSITSVKEMVDGAIAHARRSGRKQRRGPKSKRIVLYEKDFIV